MAQPYLPVGFRPVGQIQRAHYSDEAPTFLSEKRRRGARARGIRYEKDAQQYLREAFGADYMAGPWFKYWTLEDNRPRWCQPDGLLFQRLHRLVTVVEIKYHHTALAWWQIKHLYLPVVRAALKKPAEDLPPWRFNYCEVVRWNDPKVEFPETIRPVRSPLLLAEKEFGLHIWSPDWK